MPASSVPDPACTLRPILLRRRIGEAPYPVPRRQTYEMPFRTASSRG